MTDNFIVDSHCHLDLIEEKGGNIDDIVQNALDNNVKILQTISTRVSKFDQIYQYAKKYDNVFASIGNHPCNVGEEELVTDEDLIQICQNNDKVIGIGETGLDYYHDKNFIDKQKTSLIEHIKAARKTGLPLIIHNRDSDEDMIEILQNEMKKGKFKALLHCFSSSKELALTALEMDIYISISGIVTFKNAIELQNMVKEFPIEKLLVETDSPYLAPTPYRGKMNQPSYTKNTAEFLAELKNIPLQEVCKKTTNNFLELFDKCQI